MRDDKSSVYLDCSSDTSHCIYVLRVVFITLAVVYLYLWEATTKTVPINH